MSIICGAIIGFMLFLFFFIWKLPPKHRISIIVVAVAYFIPWLVVFFLVNKNPINWIVLTVTIVIVFVSLLFTFSLCWIAKESEPNDRYR